LLRNVVELYQTTRRYILEAVRYISCFGTKTEPPETLHLLYSKAIYTTSHLLTLVYFHVTRSHVRHFSITEDRYLKVTKMNWLPLSLYSYLV
jgi:hypothetical protein